VVDPSPCGWKKKERFRRGDMETGLPGNDKLKVWIHGTIAVVRVLGRGSFKLGAALREFGESSVSGGARKVVLDMEECVGMDSTFMGVVAGLALRIQALPGGRVIFVHLTDRIRHLLCTLGLNRFVDLHMIGSLPEELREAIIEPHPARVESAADAAASESKSLLDAHEALVRLDPQNLDKFRDVLEFLRRDVEREANRSARKP